MKTPLYSLNRPLPVLLSKLPVEAGPASHSHQEIDQMKRGQAVISHYKFTRVLCINMHNLGYDLNARKTCVRTEPPPLPTPGLLPSHPLHRAPWITRVIGVHVLQRTETEGGFVVDLTACSTFSFYQYISSLLLGGALP